MLGGPSAERKVSLNSGAGVAKALRSLGHTVVELDPETPDWILPPATDAVFLALHGHLRRGRHGADATRKARRALHRLRCRGEPHCVRQGADEAAVCKGRRADGEISGGRIRQDAVAAGLAAAAVVKPVRQGSSVGLQFVERVSDWGNALSEALRYDSQLLVEEKIVGRETTVGILDGVALPIVEVCPKRVLRLQNKYTAGNTEYFCPADFDAVMTKRIQEAALGAFHAIGGDAIMHGWM